MVQDGSLADGITTDEEIVDDSLSGDIQDITDDVTPENLDIDAFMDGVRPGQRAVRVIQKAYLAGVIDQIAIRAAELEDSNGDEAQTLLDQFEEAKRELNESITVFVVESRSGKRQRNVMRQMSARGIKRPGRNASDLDLADYEDDAKIHILADAIIEPQDVTAEHLEGLYEDVPSEFNKLYGAFEQACNDPAGKLTPNLSLRR